jgi:hypothetical protein
MGAQPRSGFVVDGILQIPDRKAGLELEAIPGLFSPG